MGWRGCAPDVDSPLPACTEVHVTLGRGDGLTGELAATHLSWLLTGVSGEPGFGVAGGDLRGSRTGAVLGFLDRYRGCGSGQGGAA
jgi:hypothetical protein